jgi:DNA-directed RNA polymerase subunit beta'
MHSVKMMIISGARGSYSQLTQVCGIKGLVLSPTGEVIELPIKGNYKEGLTGLEYFVSSHGARKGRSDTSLRTQDSGYLTRRMVDVSQDLVVNEVDCKSKSGITVSRLDSDDLDINFASRLAGRVSAVEILDPKSKSAIVKAGEEITDEQAKIIEESGITEIIARSPIHCKSEKGVCQKCYGRDLATGKTIKLGEAAGIMAAQAIGEPGTQLTLRTFHTGGVAATDITSGLPRVEELFEARTPKRPAVIAEIGGVCRINEEKDSNIITIQSTQIMCEEYKVTKDYNITVKNGDVVKPKQAVAISHGKKAIRTGIHGKIKLINDKIIIESNEPVIKQYNIPTNVEIIVKNGQDLKAGDILTEGHLELSESIKYRGVEETQRYIIKNIQEIYSSQGQAINDKHVEMILKRMFAKVKVTEPGDSDLLPGQIMDKKHASTMEKELKGKSKKHMPQYEEIVMGISRVARSSDSFLSAASFIETTRVLIDAAARGAIDNLQGLKENVIIGKLIPAGTGFKKGIE